MAILATLQPTTIEVIKDLLDEQLETHKPTKLHLEHQLSLKPPDRIIDMSEDQLEENVKVMRHLVYRLDEAKNDFIKAFNLSE